MSYSYSDGFVSLSLIDGGEYRAPLADYDRLSTAWQAGETFLHFRTVHGARVVLKASRIDSIAESTAETLAEWKRLRAEEKATEMLEGES